MNAKRTANKTAKTQEPASLPMWLTIMAETAASKAQELQAAAEAGR